MNQKKSSKSPTILVVDDDKDFLKSMEFTLLSNEITNVECCQDSRKVMPLLEKKKFSLILLDMRMPNVDGKELLPQIIEKYPEIPVIVVTGYGRSEIAVECMKAGAFDYLEKPFDEKVLLEKVQAAIIFFSEIKTRSKAMYYIFQRIRFIAKKGMPVLITGETGVGKELIARAIHKVSQRKGDFVAVNISGRDENLLSNELFGHKKGAFTDAHEDRNGLIEEARGGTLFLDEIGDLSIQSQVKLLRLIESGKYYPLGSDKPVKADTRIIAATNKDVKEAINREQFRDDLYYRFDININIPPLRDRKEDIPVLVNHFLEMASGELDTQNIPTNEEVLKRISNYDFPGNVRELRSMIFDMVGIHQLETLSPEVIKGKIKIDSTRLYSSPPNDKSEMAFARGQKVSSGDSFPNFSTMEAIYFNEVMKQSKGIKAKAAEKAGLPTRTFGTRYDKIKEKLEKKGQDFADLPDFADLLKSLV